ncbi:MAG: two-component system response regulator CreB [Cellvibrionaceae bacterium]
MRPEHLILVVEDEASIADNIMISLKSEGFIGKHVSLAQEAVDSVKSESPSLVVLDVGLPDFSGFEACKEIRIFSPVPIIFLTARSDEVDRVVGLEIGADDYMTKPFSPRELVARIKLRLRDSVRTHASCEPLSKAGSFTIDLSKKSIAFQGEILNLTAFEFGILKIMLEQPERVFTREQLIASVRDLPDVVLERAVDNHIKTIRAKIKHINSSVTPIKTHRGLGYSIQP